MNGNLLTLTILQTLVLLLLFILIVYGMYWMVMNRLSKSYQLTTINTATAIVLGSLFFTTSYFLFQVGEALRGVFRLLGKSMNTTDLILAAMKYVLYFSGTTVIAIILVQAVAAYLFSLTQKESYLAEIAANKIPAALMFSVYTICLALLTADGLAQVFEAWLPYPTLPSFQ
ncbi:MAG: hypothetical protein C7N36_21770 [Bacteroidetes bacterium]|nr:MAG: hypothetical protein C7N36_21770 [Bacteroidota bacterium]